MNNEEEAGVKNREIYVESENHSHRDLPEFDRGLDTVLLSEWHPWLDVHLITLIGENRAEKFIIVTFQLDLKISTVNE